MKKIRYLDFDLTVERTANGYRTRVLTSPVGPADADFVPTFTDLEVDNFFLRMGGTRRSVRRINSPEMESAKKFGGQLFSTLFKDDVRACLRSSLDEAARQEAGLRVRLRLTDAPDLVDLPWEFLFNSSLNRFLSLSSETPLIRFIEMPERVRPLNVKPPLKLLVVISSPNDYDPLDVNREWDKLNEALGDIIRRGLLTVERLPDGRLSTLQKSLRQGEYHILHFVGHGGFNAGTQDGVLLFEDDFKRGRQVSGQELGMLLYDHSSLRLAVLNACEGARTSRTDPFAGVAQSMVQQRIPAVIAMQFEITDEAAITLAHEFYGSLADGYPVDASLGEARKAIFAQGNEVEWGTPVLYLRAPDGRIFDVEQVSDEEKKHMQAAALAREAQAVMDKGDWPAAVEKWQAVLAVEPDQKAAADKLKEAQQKLEQKPQAVAPPAAAAVTRSAQVPTSQVGAPLVAPAAAPEAPATKPKGRSMPVIPLVAGALLLFVVAAGIGLYALGGASRSGATSTPDAAQAAVPVVAVATATPVPADTATPVPPVTVVVVLKPTKTATAASTPTNSPTAVPTNPPTATVPPPTPPPTVVPTATLPPNVYVTAIRTDPSAPKGGLPVIFDVTFLNTRASPTGFRWRVRVYKPDNLRSSLGDTSPLNSTIPVGATELATANNWHLSGSAGCTSLVAQVFWVDPETQQEGEFAYPGENRILVNFQVCP